VKAGTNWTTVAAAVLASACGHAPVAPRSRLTTPEIARDSKPAIVRVEVGQDRIGTGFVIDKGGLVATNLHVVVASDDISVTMLDGTKYRVNRVVGYDQDHDLALLDIDPPSPIPALKLGDSSAMSAGDTVIAIGNPLGVLDYTVSDGILSAVRILSPTFTLLQITAPISQGSSGGPLFNNYGEVVGIVNAFLGGGQNLNFAIPANYLKLLAASAHPPITVQEFKTETEKLVEDAVKKDQGDKPPDDEKVVRDVPHYELAFLDGCTKEALLEAGEGISGAIQRGAPLYNQGDYDGCFLIYEAISIKFQDKSSCAGVRKALSDGLARAETKKTSKVKAWAIRDAFDGLINQSDNPDQDGVIVRKLRTLGATGGTGTGVTPVSPK